MAARFSPRTLSLLLPRPRLQRDADINAPVSDTCWHPTPQEEEKEQTGSEGAASSKSEWECVKAALELISATDLLPGKDLLQEEEEHAGGATRGFNGSEWDSFCERVRSKSVFPTCVIDFPFAAAGVLDLKGDDRSAASPNLSHQVALEVHVVDVRRRDSDAATGCLSGLDCFAGTFWRRW